MSLSVYCDRRTRVKILWIFVLLLPVAGCLSSNQSESQKHADANTPAGKVGKAAHAVAVQSGKAANALAKDLGKAAREARAGWQEAAEQDKEKKR